MNDLNANVQYLLTELQTFPEEWRYTPVGSNKAPYLNDWQIKHLTKKELAEHIKFDRGCRAIGLLCGTPSGGLLLLDLDGESCTEYFPKLFGVPVSDLPDTVTVTSGRPGRCQRVYRIPQEYWGSIKSKDFKTGVKGDDGKDEKIELRWDGRQSVIAGKHPMTGSYKYHPGESPSEIEVAEAPTYLIEKMLIPTPPKTDARNTYQYRGTTTSEADKAREYLAALASWRADSYDDWLHVGMALHSVGDDSLLDDWDKWSQHSNNYEAGCCESKWNSFGGDGISIASLCYWAKQDGWKSKSKSEYTKKVMINATSEELESQRLTGLKDNGYKATKLDTSEKFKQALAEVIDETDIDRELILRAQITSDFRIPSGELDKRIRSKRQEKEAQQVNNFVFDLNKLFEEEQAEDFLVPGMLPRGGSVILAGDPKTGKTLLAYELAFAVATGGEFLGEKVTQGNVLIFQVERPGKNLQRLVKRGFTKDLLTSSVRVLTKYTPELLEQELAANNYTLVIIDSLTAINVDSGVSEWSKEYADPIYKMQPLIEKAKATCVILHHLNKSNEAVGVRQLRGSAAIPGAVWGCLVLKHVMKQDPYNKKKFTIDPSETHRTLELVGLQDSGGAALDIELDVENNSWINHGEVGIAREDLEARQTMRERILHALFINYPQWVSGVELKEILGITTSAEYESMKKSLSRLADRHELTSKPNPKKLSSRLYTLPPTLYTKMSLNLTQAYTQQWIQKGDSVLDVPNVSIDTPKNSDILSPSGNAYQESVRGKLGDKLEYRVGGGVSMTGARVEIKAQSLCSGAGFGNTEVSVEAELKPIAPRGTKPEGGDTLLYIGKGDLQGKLFVAGRHSDREGMLLGSTTPLKYIECLPLQNAEAVKHAWNNPYASYNDVVIVKSVRGKVAKDYGA